jgi:AcrR family transcriptional regulator
MTSGTIGAWAVRGARDRDASPTRHTLLSAAEEVFARKGFGATTVADITSGAGTGRATFYVYFASKGEIFRALADDVRAELCAAQDVPDDGPPSGIWQAAVSAYLAAWTRRIGLLRVIAHQAIDDPEIRGMLDEIRAVPTRRHRRFVERLQAEGAARPMMSAELIAHAVQGVVERYAELVDAGELEPDAAIAALTVLYARLVRF